MNFLNNKLTYIAAITIALGACDGATLLSSDADAELPEGLAFSDFEIVEAELNIDSEVDFIETIDFGNSNTESGEPQSAAASSSDGRSHIVGDWSSSYPWPLAPIHAALLPNGSVLTYGAGAVASKRGRAFEVDRWDPTQGLSPSAHQFTPTGIENNIFCSAQSVLPNGNVLISGGDKQSAGRNNNSVRNSGIRATTLYQTSTHMLADATPMQYDRWYPTLVTLPNGNQLTMGGRAQKKTSTSQQTVATIPERFDYNTGNWTALRGAQSDTFYRNNWFYPRAFLNNRGTVTVIGNDGKIHDLSPENSGSFRQVGTVTAGFGRSSPPLPALMYDVGKVLMMNRDGGMFDIDINNVSPSSRKISDPSTIRWWGNASVLADGQVFLVGGASERQKLAKAVHYGEIWNPSTDTWQATRESSDKKARLYHSISLLLPDASVLVAGGGPPGPVINMNADIFYPPYLFKTDGSGNRADRPVIRDGGTLGYDKTLNVVMDNSQRISRVTLVRAGSATHSFDSSQRFMDLTFSQSGSILDVEIPASRSENPPGLYMMFVINDLGVPSEATIGLLR